MSGQVYALASGKGGVGKTTVAVNLGVTLRANRHSVALVDADLGMANLATLLGIEPAVTIHDVLAGEATVEESLSEEASGFAVLPGRRDLAGFAAADPDGLGAVLDALSEAYEFVLVDTGGGISYEDVLPLGVVDGTILVTTPDDAAVGDTAKTIEMIHLLGGEPTGVVVNRATEATDPGGVAARLGIPLLGTIPEDGAVTESGGAGQPIKQYDPDSPATAAFGRLAETLDDGAGAEEAPATDNWETSPEDSEDGDGAGSSAENGTTAGGATAEPDTAEHDTPADGIRADERDDPEADASPSPATPGEETNAPGNDDAAGETAASDGDPAGKQAEHASEPAEPGDEPAVIEESATDDPDGVDAEGPDAAGSDGETVEGRDGDPTTAGSAADDDRAGDAEDGGSGEDKKSPGAADETTADGAATASDDGESAERMESGSGGRFGWLSRIFG